jgi:hypothetical protein
MPFLTGWFIKSVQVLHNLAYFSKKHFIDFRIKCFIIDLYYYVNGLL